MKVWLIEPRDPVIFRDGRPFNANPGARAKTLSFPFPSTVVGAARTRAGRNGSGHFDKDRISELLTKEVRGPLLVELDEKGGVLDWYFPTPADALVLKHEPYDKRAGRLVALTVLELPAGVSTDLDKPKLAGVEMDEKGKPHAFSPAFWRRDRFETWLLEPKTQDVVFVDLGISGPVQEGRMHVSIAHDSQTAEEGALFQTTGLEFISVEKGEDDEPPQFDTAKRLALALKTNVAVSAGFDFLGGERRTVRWLKCDDDLPTCPGKVREKIKEDGHCRLILLTPGLFEKGYLPKLDPQVFGGVEVTVVAAAVNRYQTVSGWDYEKDKPKPTRRLAPAGSVYFLKLDGDDAAIGRFIDAVWMHNISDHPQDRLDGFGLAVLGVWDGNAQNMEVKDESQS